MLLSLITADDDSGSDDQAIVTLADHGQFDGINALCGTMKEDIADLTASLEEKEALCVDLDQQVKTITVKFEKQQARLERAEDVCRTSTAAVEAARQKAVDDARLATEAAARAAQEAAEAAEALEAAAKALAKARRDLETEKEKGANEKRSADLQLRQAEAARVKLDKELAEGTKLLNGEGGQLELLREQLKSGKAAAAKALAKRTETLKEAQKTVRDQDAEMQEMAAEIASLKKLQSKDASRTDAQEEARGKHLVLDLGEQVCSGAVCARYGCVAV